jgi:HK97 family phage portal protein
MFHDRMVCLFHPLIGVTPIFACGAAAMQGLTIQNSASKLFSNSTQPGGILIAPKGIDDTQAARLQHKWQTEFSGDNFGKVAVLGGELQYTPLGMTAVDSQLIDQLKWSDERICSAYHVPPYMVGVGPPPPYANFEPLQISYLSQCLQAHIKNLEDCLDEGMGIAEKVGGKQYGVEFDLDDLIWMDNQTRTTSAKEGITGGLSFNEVRKKYYGVKPVKGGESPMSQQQNFSIAALAERDANDPFAKPTPAPPQTATSAAEDQTPMPRAASYAAALNRKMTEAGLFHAA